RWPWGGFLGLFRGWRGALDGLPPSFNPFPSRLPARKPPAMSLLVLSGVTIRLGGRTLLDGADLTVDPGRRIGLVGRNGAGKTTLLRAIAGEFSPDGGEIRLATKARVATVHQQAPDGPQSLTDTVLQGDPERLALLAEEE